jgi:adenylate kinase family enzyme
VTVASIRSRVVELVGPAGAGKTTLAAALPSFDSGVVNGPGIWGLPRHLLLASALELLPTFLAGLLSGRPFHGPEMAQMIRLAALRRAVERAREGGSPTILLDEGPVFGLSWLEVFFASDHDARRAEWRRRTLSEWAFALDAVVRMDADDEAIKRRIRTRRKPHMVKHLPDEGIDQFTGRFRDAFDRIIAHLEACGPVEVRHVPSFDGQAADDAERVRAALQDIRGA